MNCREAEGDLLRSMDGALDPGTRQELGDHLLICPGCRTLAADYAALRADLRGLNQGAPKPFFWERVNSRIEALGRPEPLGVWRQWCLRAIPVSLFALGVFVGGLVFLPSGDDNLSQSEALLLRNANPMTETKAFLDEGKSDDRSSMVIFTASERTPERRPRP